MTTSTYTPQPGTIAARAIQILRGLSAPVSTAVLAAHIDQPPAVIPGSMEYAVRAGAVRKELREGRAYWAMGDGKPASEYPDDDDEPPVQRTAPANGAKPMLPSLGWKPPETAPAPKEQKKAKPPAFNPEHVLIRSDVPIPQPIHGGARSDRYGRLLAQMKPGDSVELLDVHAKSLIACAKKKGVKVIYRTLGQGMAGVWRLEGDE